ncbi:GNAT family N-acetyltransferase [Amycolatopsis suaedae]|uniref:GNAT family N-acetyltransferase n=1 Tax=Amycolatopsis suaedae TaxID=2510978 RepID=UPI001F0E61BE|nr:GNAT family N-acetyltransferase [Amycolatopsis suaedae]
MTVDPLLPPPADPPEGERVHARTADGRQVTGVLYRAVHEPDSWGSLWSGLETWELTPLLEHADAGGMAALLAVVRSRVDRATLGPEWSCTVCWPSRDTAATRALLDAGFAALDALAVRTAPPEPARPPQDGLTIRLAGQADAVEVLRLWLEELRYSEPVGLNRVRSLETMVRLLEPEVRRSIDFDRNWLAEADGIPVGLARCGWLLRGKPGRLPPGRWGLINTLSVTRDARGGGVGAALVNLAHRELLQPGVAGTFLHYSPLNPLSSVFWHRQGYRPLWTTWVLR